MPRYDPVLKEVSRQLRTQMTDSEQLLWSRLRGKQILGVEFYRQQPIGGYVVDFYAPRVRLVVEVDGPQHLDADHVEKDTQREAFLASQGLKVLRFHNLQALQELDAVVEAIFHAITYELGANPPSPPLRKGG